MGYNQTMDIRTLQYFLAVAREESITKAANFLNMTQPPLSRQMKDLEDEIGKQLFVRGTKNIVLTEDGHLLKRRAEEIIALMEKTKAELTCSTQTIAGDILIGAGETEGISVLAECARTLSANHPQIHYKLYSGDAPAIKERLDNGLIDFGLFIGNVDINRYEYIKLPATERWGVIMKKEDDLESNKTITSKMLKDKPLLLSHQAAENSEVRRWLNSEASKLNVMVTYDLAYNASVFVKKGIGYMLALDNIIDTSENSGLAFRPLEPAMSVEMFLVWKKHQVFGQAAKVFLEEVKKFGKVNQ